LLAEASDSRQVLGVVQIACGVRKRNIPPFPPDATNSQLGGRASWLRHAPNDLLDSHVVQGERGELGGQGPVPSLGSICATVFPRSA
jgi:hypothetical protein